MIVDPESIPGPVGNQERHQLCHPILRSGIRKTESHRGDPLGLHPESRLSSSPAFDLPFGFSPVCEPGWTLSNPPLSRTQDVRVPWGRRNCLRGTAQVIPNLLQHLELFADCHLVKPQSQSHNICLRFMWGFCAQIFTGWPRIGDFVNFEFISPLFPIHNFSDFAFSVTLFTFDIFYIFEYAFPNISMAVQFKFNLWISIRLSLVISNRCYLIPKTFTAESYPFNQNLSIWKPS